MASATIPQQFLRVVETHKNPVAFKAKVDGRWVETSHQEMFDKVANAAAALATLNLAKNDRVALISENRTEWALADIAILSASCVTVPVYPTLPSKQVEYILRDSESRLVFVADRMQLDKVLECRARLPVLQNIVCFDPGCKQDGVMTLTELIEKGRSRHDKPDYRAMIETISKDDWASIIYTSGTTGDPKGAILTHWNFMSAVNSALQIFEIGPRDRCLSFLPLSHVFERVAGYYTMMSAGATIAYAESIETIPQNLAEISPTIMCSVPRLYEKMYARVMDMVDKGSGLKKGIFKWAVAAGRQFVNESIAGDAGGMTKSRKKLADALVFKKIKARTGGKLRFFISGGAPLAREIAEFFYSAGIPILEGYGLTETAAIVSVNTLETFRFGTIGKAVPGMDIRIADDGEILCRGDNVMQGYFKKPDKTAEVIIDGWFHTGDIGHIDKDGFIVITDRKKDIIVTAGGKNVAPQPIEAMIKQSPYVAEAILIGDRRRFISALLVPNFEKLEEFAAGNNLPTSLPDLIKTEQVLDLFTAEMGRTCEGLASFETPKKFSLIDRELTVDSGELTPSLKIKRRVVEAVFSAQIEGMYAE